MKKRGESEKKRDEGERRRNERCLKLLHDGLEATKKRFYFGENSQSSINHFLGKIVPHTKRVKIE